VEQYIKHMPGTRFGDPHGGTPGTNAAMLSYLCAGAWRLTMESERDVWNTTYFYRAIRKRISETLLASYDLSQPLPDRMRILLGQLDGPNADGLSNKEPPPLPATRR
jgi:hypothetical protein